MGNTNEFWVTHQFHSGVVNVSVYEGYSSSRVINNKKCMVVFDQGTNPDCAVVRRLVIYKSSLTGFSSSLHNKAPCYEIALTEHNFCGLIKGVQNVKVGRGKQLSFCPTITVVTSQASIVLMITDTDYQKGSAKHDKWYRCLKKKLSFGGYWNIEQVPITSSTQGQSAAAAAPITDEASVTSNTVLLCLTQRRLSVLTQGAADDAFVVSEGYSTNSVVCWKLHYADRQKNRFAAELNVIVAKDEDPSQLQKLQFRISHDETVAKDISEVMSKIKIPAIQRAIRAQMPPEYLDLDLRQVHTSSSGAASGFDGSEVRGRSRDQPTSVKRLSRDDMDVPSRRPLPPTVPLPRSQPHHQVLNSYDLNALSRADSVKDAVYFYENVDFVNRHPRRAPDVVVSHLDEDEEYWSIVFTLREVLRKKTPEPDTLGLASRLRLKLCIILMDDSLPSWKNLADCIGLTEEAVKMIETLFRWHATSYNDVATPTECVLRHWQFVHNRWVASASASTPPSHPCTLPALIELLDTMGRHDLAVMLTSSATPALPQKGAHKKL